MGIRRRIAAMAAHVLPTGSFGEEVQLVEAHEGRDGPEPLPVLHLRCCLTVRRYCE